MGMENKIKVGVLPGVADLYNRLFTKEIFDELHAFIAKVPESIGSELIDFEIGTLASTQEQLTDEIGKLAGKDVDMILMLLAPYCPSGAVVPAIMESPVPVVLWPAQTVYDFVPETIDSTQIRLSHGVHAVQDIANVLRRRGKAFGVLHGHFLEDGFCGKLEQWAKAARIYSAFSSSNPVQLGGYFENMLDLQVADAAFISDSGIKMTAYDLSRLEAGMKEVSDADAQALAILYKDEFAIASDVGDEMLQATARGELAVRALMEEAGSKACGINFQTLCNDVRIGDAMHVVASRLMAEGKGYAGEGDWVTGAFVYAIQTGIGTASFSEVFSVDYKGNRVLLKHFGEGNPAMARSKPQLMKSAFNDQAKAEFCIVDMQFAAGPATLVNLNTDPQGKGQLISIRGEVTEDEIPKSTGPRAMFRPSCASVHTMLDEYAYNGGSHHQVLVGGDVDGILNKLAILVGWSYLAL